MPLRQISEHVKDQNWLAIALDFFIVTFGVLIGLQAQQWVEGRQTRDNYHLATNRLIAELEANLSTVQAVDTALSRRVAIVSQGFDGLMSCEDTDDNRALINESLSGLIGTTGLTFRTSALQEMTESQLLLSQQTEQTRQRFSNLRYSLEFFQREANLIEELPLRVRVENNPGIAIGDLQTYQRNYRGFEWSSRRRPLILAEPVSLACKNNDLIKSYYYWEKWQGEMLAMTKILKARFTEELEAFK